MNRTYLTNRIKTGLTLALNLIFCVSFSFAEVNFGVIRLNEPKRDSEPTLIEQFNFEEPNYKKQQDFRKIFSLSPNIEFADRSTYFRVAQIIDGVKVRLDNGMNVSLLGLVSSSELHDRIKKNWFYFKPIKNVGRYTHFFLKNLIESKRLRIVFPKESIFDDEGDLCVYVYLDTGEMLNELMLESGYGLVSENYYIEKFQKLKAAEDRARIAGSGFWKNYKLTNASPVM